MCTMDVPHCLGVLRVCFFFSSRRRHTRFDCDWSSDVCSSDLFVFEALEVEWIVNDLIDDPAVAAFFAPWQPLVEGTPRLAHERFYWCRDEEKQIGRASCRERV